MPGTPSMMMEEWDPKEVSRFAIARDASLTTHARCSKAHDKENGRVCVCVGGGGKQNTNA